MTSINSPSTSSNNCNDIDVDVTAAVNTSEHAQHAATVHNNKKGHR